jgi:C-terminal processing protease CtpA/Prc
MSGYLTSQALTKNVPGSYDLAMARFLLALFFTTQALVCQAQQVKPQEPSNRSTLDTVLRFESAPTGDMPGGWSGGPPGTIFADDKVVHSGRWAARIERNADSLSDFSTITKSLEMDFSGATIELRGFLRTEDVSNFVGLWMREDGETAALAFENMQNRQIRGTTAWTEYSISLPVHSEARKLFFGVLLSGTGKAWADDLQLLVDGKPIGEVPRVERPTTVLERDHQFDAGSGIVISGEIPKIQVENLVTLGRVWGFLKYHHPKVTTGQIHWDYELLRVMPQVLSASDRASANAVLAKWIDGLGPIAACEPCAKLEESDLYLRSDVGWIASKPLLGGELSQRLQAVYANRLEGRQFYVSKVPDVGNPSFNHELEYESLKFPDAGFQILGLFRFWNMVEYWYPYRDVTGEQWSSVLSEFIPRIALAENAEAYQRELMALIAKAHDGHANLWSSLQARPPVGTCQLPMNVRFIENLPVISGLPAAAPNEHVDLRVGDVITSMDGVPISKLIESWTPYYGASNEAAKMFNIGRYMTRGGCGETSIGVRRGTEELKFKVTRGAPPKAGSAADTHDLPGPTFRLLSKDVAYLKLSSVKADEAAHYVEEAAGTKGFIIDIRNYPSEFMVFALGSLLVDSNTPFARFTACDLSNPGAFYWTKPISLTPQKPHYSGKIVILVDESSMSQAEYTSMAFRAARGAIVVGSSTAGADGDVSRFALPGGLQSMVSGVGVFYPDKIPTQRVGIVPNVDVRPTIAGIRAGRDLVLEEALHQILGPQVPLTDIEKMAKP